MYKKSILGIIACVMMTVASSQTLFTYGNTPVDAKEFLRAFNKNNQAVSSAKAKAISDYLELYIRSKLKVQEAIDRGYDSLPMIRGEIENLRMQIIENYMTDPQTEEKLVSEAFQRSLKDIHVAHIFISFKNSSGIDDTTAANQKLKTVQQRLQKGEDFLTVAQETSDDPSAKNNKGDIGYITVFSLPYEFENIVYSTAPGKYSTAFRSKAGFHIFKNLGERKALGKIKAQHILLAFPPGTDEAAKKQILQKADSLYKRIVAGEDFGKLASQFSNDYITAVNSGNMPEFGVGKYDDAFENAVWSLSKDGAVSKPFETGHGYHIVKRLGTTPIIADQKNKTNLQDLKQKVMLDSRWQKSRDVFYQYIIKKTGFEKFSYDNAALWLLSDSILNARPVKIPVNITMQTALFKIGDSTLTANDFISYARTFRYKSDGSGLKQYPDIMDEFMETVAFQYYRNHLEKYNDDCRYQMNEFREGNLFFEIMQREIWNRSQVDSAALMEIYLKNKSKYTWRPSADAIIFFCADEDLCKTLREQVKKKPASWKEYTEAMQERVLGDSARYEFHQIPSADKVTFKAGMITSSVINKDDNTATFAYIVKVYPQPGQRSFEEAKGLLVNDYQTELDEKWVAELKKKYPVKVNEDVLKAISK